MGIDSEVWNQAKITYPEEGLVNDMPSNMWVILLLYFLKSCSRDLVSVMLVDLWEKDKKRVVKIVEVAEADYPDL